MRGVQQNLTGQVFGKLKVEGLGNKVGYRYFWKCRCECGGVVEVRNDNLGPGGRDHCGCRRGESQIIDLTGQKFGRLRVVGLTDRKDSWDCVCSCGKQRPVRGKSLRGGTANSCGCLRREKATIQARSMGLANLKHGETGSPEWIAWCHIRQRCENPDATGYEDYGGRGINVCDRWKGDEGFANFLADMGKKPTSRHSIDRFPNQRGNYEPGNCRWATQKEQCRNKTNNILMTYNGKEQCVAAWAEEFGMTRFQLWRRIKAGWPMHEALTTPVDKRNTRVGYKRSASASS